MSIPFDQRFDAEYDLRPYHEAKGYQYEGYSARWEPQDPVDLQPLEPTFGPGAMTRGELDLEEFLTDNDEPGLSDEQMDEPEEF